MIQCFFKRPEEIPADILEQICRCVIQGKGVGTKLLRDNLANALLVAYAMDGHQVVGTSVHKRPQEGYRKKIEQLSGLDLSDYIERGYTAVLPPYQGQEIGNRLVQGLVKRSAGQKIYVTIRLDNEAPLRMTQRVGMTLKARFFNNRTGQEIGVFTNQPESHLRYP